MWEKLWKCKIFYPKLIQLSNQSGSKCPFFIPDRSGVCSAFPACGAGESASSRSSECSVPKWLFLEEKKLAILHEVQNYILLVNEIFLRIWKSSIIANPDRLSLDSNDESDQTVGDFEFIHRKTVQVALVVHRRQRWSQSPSSSARVPRRGLKLSFPEKDQLSLLSFRRNLEYYPFMVQNSLLFTLKLWLLLVWCVASNQYF